MEVLEDTTEEGQQDPRAGPPSTLHRREAQAGVPQAVGGRGLWAQSRESSSKAGSEDLCWGP